MILDPKYNFSVTPDHDLRSCECKIEAKNVSPFMTVYRLCISIVQTWGLRTKEHALLSGI